MCLCSQVCSVTFSPGTRSSPESGAGLPGQAGEGVGGPRAGGGDGQGGDPPLGDHSPLSRLGVLTVQQGRRQWQQLAGPGMCHSVSVLQLSSFYFLEFPSIS